MFRRRALRARRLPDSSVGAAVRAGAIVVAAALAIFYLRQSTAVAARGYEIDNLAVTLADVRAEQQQLIMAVAQTIAAHMGPNREGQNQFQILAALTKLRRAACDPRLVAPNRP